MAPKDLSVSSDQESISSISARPATLLQRLSSFLASIPIRRVMSQRTQTAPNSENTPPSRWMRVPFRRENSTSSLPQNLRVPTVDICPNDPNVYYSFPRFEDEQCDCHSVFCGLCRNDRRRSSTADWPSRATESIRRCSLSRPCTPSRAGQPCAHLAMDRRAILNVARRNNSSRFAEMMDEPPLNVRISSSPRTLGGGARRISVPATAGFSPRPSTRRGPVPENQRGPTFESLLQRPYSPQSNNRKTPSPKLHHFLGNEAHPYVHRHEAESFLSTAGPSVLPGLSTPSNRASYPDTRRGSNASQYYADTVYYPPRSPSPRPASFTPSVHGSTRPVQPTRRPPTSSTVRAGHTSAPRISSPLVSVSNVENVHASGRVTVDRNGRPVSFDMELATTDVYRIHGERHSHAENSRTHHHNSPANDNSGSSADTRDSSATETLAQTPSTIGGRRLELRGGAPGAPRLRGGGGSGSESRLSVSTIGKRLRDIFWTCGGNCNVPDPYDDLPPPRLRLNYTNPLAGGRARASVPVLRGGSVKPANEQHTPRLRGGGKSEETKSIAESIINFDDDGARIPSLLWFLVGGTGCPMTVGQWRKQKPKKRMSGVLGIAIYGRKAGMPYEDKTCLLEEPKCPEEPKSPKKLTTEKPAEEKLTPDTPPSDPPASKNPTPTEAPLDVAASNKTPPNYSGTNDANPDSDSTSSNDAPCNNTPPNDATPANPPEQDAPGDDRSTSKGEKDPSSKRKDDAPKDDKATPGQNDGAEKKGEARSTQKDDAPNDDNATPEQKSDPEKNVNDTSPRNEAGQETNNPPASQKPATKHADSSESLQGNKKRKDGAAQPQPRRKRSKKQKKIGNETTSAKGGTTSPKDAAGGGGANGGSPANADSK